MTNERSAHTGPEPSRQEPGGLRREEVGGERQPLVTVVIPCYNQAHFLGEAIESVLSQSYKNVEVIVVDDGSTDDTAEVASRYGETVHLIRQENRGLAGARNRGLGEAEGEYVVFLDSDDRLLPEALEVGVRELEAHPECAYASGHCRWVGADGSVIRSPRRSRIEGDHYLELLRYNHVWFPGSVMYRRSIFETVGVFDGRFDGAADFDLYLRITRRFPVHDHGEVILEYRRHDANMTHNAESMLKDTVMVFRSQRKYLKRKQEHQYAYKLGLQSGQEIYGVPLAEQVQTYIRTGEWTKALRGSFSLLYYYPRGFALISERRRERYVLPKKFDAISRRLENRERHLQANKQRLEKLKDALTTERRKTQRLRKRNKHLTSRVQELSRQVQSVHRSKKTWSLPATLNRIKAKLGYR